MSLCPRITVSLSVAVATLALVPAASATTTRTPSHVLRVYARADHRVSAPSTTRPGVTRVRAVGPQSIELYRPRAKVGASALAADLDYALHKSSLAHLQRDFTSAGEIDSGLDGYLPLSSGRYYIVGEDPDGTDYRAADIRTLRVLGARANAPVPPSDRISIAADGTVVTHAMTTHRRYVTLANNGTETAVAAVRVATSVPNAAVRRFLAHPTFSGLHRVSPGRNPDYRIAQDAPAARSVVLPQFVTAGRYVVIVLHYPHGHIQNAVVRRQATSFTVH